MQTQLPIKVPNSCFVVRDNQFHSIIRQINSDGVVSLYMHPAKFFTFCHFIVLISHNLCLIANELKEHDSSRQQSANFMIYLIPIHELRFRRPKSTDLSHSCTRNTNVIIPIKLCVLLFLSDAINMVDLMRTCT